MIRILAVLGSILCTSAVSQQTDVSRHDLGFPALPPITSTSPKNSILYADRLELPGADTISATVTTLILPETLTGTGFKEPIAFQLPDGYDALGPAHPLVVAYHGFGGSATSSGNQSDVDEEANLRNWAYLSVTGLDDQVFGTPLSQQNTYTAIQWMLDNFNVDPDRIYMVGFSIGAGIVANFAARHRDPDRIMIAGLGMVSGTSDWTMEYNLGIEDLHAWMENPYNFGGPPSTHLFRYQAASTIYQDESSYPPTPGLTIDQDSLAQNIANLPIYMTFDEYDFILHVPHVNEDLEVLLASYGNTVTKSVQSGTVYPPDPTIFVPHSWFVLEEPEFFDLMDGVTVDRFPGTFFSRQEAGGRVSYLTTTQRTPDEFVQGDASVSLAGDRITLSNVQNATEVLVNVGEAGLSGFPIRVTATSADGDGFRLKVTGFSASPSRMYVLPSKALMTGVDSEPSTGSLMVDVPAGSTLDVLIRHDPTWTTTLTTSPNPVATGSPVSALIDGPPTSVLAYLILSLNEQLIPLNPVVVTASPLPPAFVRLLPLDGNGDAVFAAGVPNDPMLVGLRLASQVITTTGGQDFESVSNLWGLYVE